MKRLGKILLACLLFFAVERFCRMQTDGFRVAKTVSKVPYSAEWETSSLSTNEEAHLKELLNQPFSFLGSGVQCYAFVSADGQYVLKLFKHYHMWPDNDLLKEIPGMKKTVQKREERMRHLFSSSKTAYEDYRQETGLLYIHLNRSEGRYGKLKVFDKLHIEQELDLDCSAFLIQRRAELVYPHLETLLKRGDENSAKEALNSLLTLILSRSQKGIANSDPIMHRNFGFIDDQAVEIDIGSFTKNPYMKNSFLAKQQLFFETRALEEWLQKEHPQLLDHLHEKIHDLLSQS